MRTPWHLALSLGLLQACAPRAAVDPVQPAPAYRFSFAGAERDCSGYRDAASGRTCSRSALAACLRDVEVASAHKSPLPQSAVRALEQACSEQGPCACAMFGIALTYAPEASRQVDGIRRIDAACSAGVVDACDDGLLLAALCAEGGSGAHCDELRRAGALPHVEPELVWKVASLPAFLRTCFESRRISLCTRPDSLWWLGDAWDVESVSWSTTGGGRWRAHDGDRLVLELDGASMAVSLGLGGAEVLRAVGPARRAELDSAIALLPSVREACEAAAACQRALDAALRQRGGAPDSEREGEEGLASCLQALDEARSALGAIDGASAAASCPAPPGWPKAKEPR